MDRAGAEHGAGLLRGTYPIVFGVNDARIEEMRKEGMPVMQVLSLPDLEGTVTMGNGLVAMFKDAPHPNAAQLAVNWLASRRGSRSMPAHQDGQRHATISTRRVSCRRSPYRPPASITSISRVGNSR